MYACVLSHSFVYTLQPLDCGPPGFSVHGILQARILEWVAIHDPRIKPMSPALQEDSLPSEAPGKPSHGSKQYYFSSKC